MSHRDKNLGKLRGIVTAIAAISLTLGVALIAARVQASRMRDVEPGDVLRLRPPAIGTPIALPGLDALGKPLRLDRERLVIVLPPCDSCLASHLPESQLKRLRVEGPIVCLQEPLSRLPKKLRDILDGSRSRYFEAGRDFPVSLLVLAPCAVTISPDRRLTRFVDGDRLAEFLERGL
jgi:hypothetical protein